MVPVLVTIRDGVVHSAKICKDGADLEASFTKEVKEYGVEPCEDDFSNGFIELEDAVICMSWAEGDFPEVLSEEELEDLRAHLSDIAIAKATRRESNISPLSDTEAIDLFNKLIDAMNKGTDEVLESFTNPAELTPGDLFEKIKDSEAALTEELFEKCKGKSLKELEDFFNEECIPLYPMLFNRS